ncbi:hypothetical protein, partial [Mycobacterium tuberculosis]
LRSTPETSRRLRSQIRESPDSPGRFILRLIINVGPLRIAELRLGINRHTADIPTTVHQCGPRGQAAFLAVGGIGSVNSV